MQVLLVPSSRTSAFGSLSLLLRVGALVAALGTLGSASPAKAMHLYAGALGGYGFATQEVGGVDPFGLALGASAGVTLPIIPIYVGGRVLWFNGSTRDFVGTGEASRNYLTYGVDLGYDAELGPLVLRPSLGIGSASLSGTIKTGSATFTPAKDSTLYLSPGVALLFKAGLLYAGGELRYNVLTRTNRPDGVAILASFGLML